MDAGESIPRVYRYERVDSTMDLLHLLAAEGAPAGTAVVAGEQLGGRGSRGRSWHSPPGGLWLSLLFRPTSAAATEVMSLRVGLSVARTIDRSFSTSVGLKWPNDLMLGERKLGGILCEACWQGQMLAWVAVGVGLNVRNRPPAELRQSAVALVEELPDVQVDDLLDPIVAGLQALDLRAERLSPDELDQFATRSWLRGRQIREPLPGMVAGVGADGSLRIQTADGEQVAVRSGSVTLADLSPTR
jgi:BirA family transcriptional regulator, biotin operon repressor / biotin---[acetyl-CoA-carboxylase] ligase